MPRMDGAGEDAAVSIERVRRAPAPPDAPRVAGAARRTRRRLVVGDRSAVAVAVAIVAIALGGCEHAHEGSAHEHAAPAQPGEGNVVQNEMRLLHTAMQESVTAIANDDLGAIPPALHRVHGARAATEAALESGSYRPPRNPERLEAFVAMDEAFHAELEQLLAAAQANDSARTATQLGTVLSRCSGCHAQFRPETAAPRHDHAH